MTSIEQKDTPCCQFQLLLLFVAQLKYFNGIFQVPISLYLSFNFRGYALRCLYYNAHYNITFPINHDVTAR